MLIIWFDAQTVYTRQFVNNICILTMVYLGDDMISFVHIPHTKIKCNRELMYGYKILLTWSVLLINLYMLFTHFVACS